MLFWLLTACEREPVLAGARDPDRPDVFLVVLDTLRADHLSQYGYTRDTSPAIASFAAQATVFTAAYAPAPWTLPSTTSLLTGLAPPHHRIRTYADVLPDEVDTIAEKFSRAGWRTGAVSYNLTVSSKTGLNQGFDRFTEATGRVLAYPHFEKMVAEATDWVDRGVDDPLFLYLQPMNCHGPYRVPPSSQQTLLGRRPAQGFDYYGRRMTAIMRDHKLSLRDSVPARYLDSLEEKYDTAVRYSMDELGRFLDELRARNLYDNSLIVVTADHGEELFDHGGFSHGYSLYNEVLHVPLYVKLPGQTTGRRVDTRVSTVDLAPTLMELAHLDATGMDGRSLAPATRGAPIEGDTLVVDAQWPRRCAGRAVIQDDWKLVHIDQNYEGLRDATQLYDLKADPREQNDVASRHPDIVEQLRGALALRIEKYQAGAAYTPKNAMDQLSRERLEALGYAE